MASIARCLRAARPAGVSILAKTPRPAPAVGKMNVVRPFSVTAINPIRKYTKDHEWIDLSADKKTGVIGISEYAAEALGDVVYVELPDIGKDISKGDAIGAVESVKSAADINSPISCKVTQVNNVLEEAPGTINKVPEDDSHGGGWIAKVEVGEQGVKELDELMDAEAYKAFTAAEGDH
ncbi:hypothetical protein MCOR02_010052 [Pyricularia oryzae]|uniref:Glycine cleavage system H protein n=5 Tax=Pyricularia TaxID=48558 RepID=Q5EN16_PYRGI|nr:glycine cleavage system H protein [Pyricularia oryzae 70-15]AAX07637.1 glycine cleavage system H protein-like protein [Pyricularia grisea]ELQ34751.1 glycine cleavage system H protein [Pyricularia oryzae Y34]KAH8847729.1 hypothetical protein MCOR01_001133 [Pyricularia oryzae]EHA52534.1 glycine cleavage system H protein [Pyricularia oryzae 70-15]KAH9430342.1 hypothetical protein MCOR02_010052 [Pyricularia oryzae]